MKRKLSKIIISIATISLMCSPLMVYAQEDAQGSIAHKIASSITDISDTVVEEAKQEEELYNSSSETENSEPVAEESIDDTIDTELLNEDVLNGTTEETVTEEQQDTEEGQTSEENTEASESAEETEMPSFKSSFSLKTLLIQAFYGVLLIVVPGLWIYYRNRK